MADITLERILGAYRKAHASRKDKYEVFLFDQNREQRLKDMYAEIQGRRYVHAPYRELVLNDSKKRYIASPVFRDHILHHLVYAMVYDTLDRKMVYSSFACRKGYGLHRGVLHLRKIIRSERARLSALFGPSLAEKRLYSLKLDFSKYFFSIHHERLRAKIGKHIFDEDLRYLIDLIIGSYTSSKIYDAALAAYPCYIDEKRKGLPIGGILSQLFANFYLNDLDQHIKHSLKISFVRYMDDIILIGEKSLLLDSRDRISDFALSENLILHPRKISFHPISAGVRFAGYTIRDDRIYAGKRIRSSFNAFMDSYETLDAVEHGLLRDEKLRITSKYFSRAGCFKIADFGQSYVNKRGIVDFPPGRELE